MPVYLMLYQLMLTNLCYLRSVNPLELVHWMPLNKRKNSYILANKIFVRLTQHHTKIGTYSSNKFSLNQQPFTCYTECFITGPHNQLLSLFCSRLILKLFGGFSATYIPHYRFVPNKEDFIPKRLKSLKFSELIFLIDLSKRSLWELIFTDDRKWLWFPGYFDRFTH